MPSTSPSPSCVTAIELPEFVGAAAKARATQGRASLLGKNVYFSGPENQLVGAAWRKLLRTSQTPDSPPPHGWSPATLIGPAGCGKSLLAQGLAAAWSQHRGEDTALALTAVDFRRRLDEAINGHAIDGFRERVRGLDLLVIEDLHRLPNLRHLREELTETIDSLAERNALLVGTSLKPLSELAGFDRGLLSRFSAGLVLEAAGPMAETRSALLRHTLQSQGRRVDAGAADELAASLSGDGRTVLKAARDIQERFGAKRPIDRARVRAFLAETRGPGTPPLRDIAATVARYYSQSLRTLRGSSRKRAVVLARSVAIYLARELTPLSYDEIGRYFGGRDHTTIMHNFQRIDSNLASDKALRMALEELRQSITTAPRTAKRKTC